MSDLADWLERHQHEAFVQLEMPPSIALVVARFFEESGFEVHPMPALDRGIPKALVVPGPHLVDALVRAMMAMDTGEHSSRDCPKCRIGEHENCADDTWDDHLEKLVTCPCYARGHRDLGVAPGVDGPSPQELERLTDFRRRPIADFPPDMDLPWPE